MSLSTASDVSCCRATAAVRAGIDRDTAYGAVTPPLVLSSNFSFDGFGNKRQYDYTRSGNPTRDLLGEKLADVLADRPTLAKMLDVVEEVMGSRIESSAETIARTEVVGGYNAGAQLVRDEVGVERKEWIATLDERTRMAHSDADGEIVRQDDKFNVGGELLSHPGDPTASVSNIVNCRCSCVAIIDDED